MLSVCNSEDKCLHNIPQVLKAHADFPAVFFNICHGAQFCVAIKYASACTAFTWFKPNSHLVNEKTKNLFRLEIDIKNGEWRYIKKNKMKKMKFS